MTLTLGVATFEWEGWNRCVRSWNEKAHWWRPLRIVRGKRVVDAYQQIFETTTQDIIGFVHDDLVCLETDWDIRVTREFIDPRIGLVGFGGALGAGDPDMYKKPYELRQLARRNFMSNLREANVHGERFTGERDVSVLDGFALFVRRELLVKAGGWPMGTPIDYVGYDMWLCCMARRLGYKIRLVGVACDHIGGKSTGLNKNLEVDFEGAHRYIFDHFMDVLPAEVER